MKATMPNSVEAEQSVIGCILLDQAAFVEVAPLVRPEDFHHPALQAIYAAMLQLEASSRPIDALTVLEQMRANDTADRLRAFGGADFLTELVGKVVTAANVGHHARIVRNKSERRRRILTAQALVAAGLGDEDDEEYFARFDRAFLELSERPKVGGAVKFQDSLKAAIRAVETRAEHVRSGGAPVTGIPLPWAKLNVITAGLQPGSLNILAARPSMGKTALAGNAVEWAARKGHPAMVFTLEMSHESVTERLLAGESGIDGQRLRLGTLSTEQWKRLGLAASTLSDHPIELDDTGGLPLVDLRSRARRWAMRLKPDGPMPLVVVDYLQLVGRAEQENRQQNREQDVAAVSRGLKALAMELRCPVLALSQLNRGCEVRTDKRPTLADLRESGSIEQDADVIAFIYRDEVYSKDQCKEEDKGVAEVIVGKQRNGPVGTARLTWLADVMRFVDLSPRTEPYEGGSGDRGRHWTDRDD